MVWPSHAMTRVFLHIRAWGCGRTCFTCWVWLITDSENISKALIKKHGPAIHCLDSMRTSTDVGVHVGVDPQDRQRLSEELVADVLVRMTCDRFVGNGASNPSCFIDFPMEGDETRKHLFLSNQNRHRFLSFY